MNQQNKLLQKNSFRWIIQYGYFLAGIVIFINNLPYMVMPDHWGILVVYSMLTIICSFAPVKTMNGYLTLNNAVMLSGLLLFGTWVSIWAAILELLIVVFLIGMSPLKVCTNIGQLLITVWLTGVTNEWIHSMFVPWMIGDIFLIAIYWCINTCFVAIGAATFNNTSPLIIAKSMMKDSAMVYLLLMIMGDLGARISTTFGALTAIPLIIAYVVIVVVFHQYFARLHKVRNQVDEIKVLNESFLTTLSSTIDARDPYTHGHSYRVAYWGKVIAKEIALSKPQINQVYYGGILHDIGKIGIKDSILNKTGKLTDNEYEEIKSHPVIGYNLLKEAGVFTELLPAIRSHHERVDGKGYPDGLKAEEIPLIARILAVADAFDAMVSDRPYRNGMPFEVALERISQGVGTQFDVQIAKVFIRLIRNMPKGELSKIYSQNVDAEQSNNHDQLILTGMK